MLFVVYNYLFVNVVCCSHTIISAHLFQSTKIAKKNDILKKRICSFALLGCGN